jgi:glycosyltransferase involved in cell wall biosynthesis
MACKYSNSIIALNKRDADELKRIYKAQNINIIPISLIDSYSNTSVDNTNIPPTFIFTGNNWYANIHGITWFIDNVLEHVDIKLQITGRRMDELKDKFEHPKIEFLGFVDDLPAVLKAADYVLLPIFMGSGMKVKTCEALMYGKHIIGTTESFEGYNIEHSKVGALCNTKEEFIEAINQLCSVERNKFNKESRSYYDNYFSFDAPLEKFNDLI